MPGDRVQAKQLSEVLQRPIEIEHVGGDSKKKITRLGGQFSKNTPIRLKYEEGNGSVGHYSSLDGKIVIPHGKNTCLFDAVAVASNYDVSNLKKATANLMLHDVNRTTVSYLNNDYTNLLVGGARPRRPAGARQQSAFADRHVSESPETIEDILVAAVQGQNTRQYYKRIHCVVDENKDHFDDRADAHYDWIRPSRGTNVTYSHDESNIYVTRWNGNSPYRIDAFRSAPNTLMDFWPGAFHLDSASTPHNTAVVQIWRAGQPTTTAINDVWPDYQ